MFEIPSERLLLIVLEVDEHRAMKFGNGERGIFGVRLSVWGGGIFTYPYRDLDELEPCEGGEVQGKLGDDGGEGDEGVIVLLATSDRVEEHFGGRARFVEDNPGGGYRVGQEVDHDVGLSEDVGLRSVHSEFEADGGDPCPLPLGPPGDRQGFHRVGIVWEAGLKFLKHCD